MKILLINPPFYRFQGLEQDYVHLSLLAVGSKLEEEGHTVFIKNMEIDPLLSYKGYADRQSTHDEYMQEIEKENSVWDELRSTIQNIKPDKIGITVMNVKYRSALRVITIAKEYDIPCFVGGIHPTMNPDKYPDNVEIFQGEFEGVSRIKDLDSLPMPAYHQLLDKYSPDAYAHIITARGCPYQCKFCATAIMWDRKVTFKSVKRVIEEMTFIEKTYKSKTFTIWDETFTVKKSRLLDFCNKYSLSANWRCDTRAEALTDETVKAMVNSGCIQMSVGIESGVDHVLKSIKKGETTKNFIKSAEILNKYNVQWKAYGIIGFPYEDEEDIIKTVEFIISLKPFRITLSFFTPYPGTELYDECIDLNLIKSDYDPTLYAHQSPYNYFSPKIEKKRYAQLKKEVSLIVDKYNEKALKTWK